MKWFSNVNNLIFRKNIFLSSLEIRYGNGHWLKLGCLTKQSMRLGKFLPTWMAVSYFIVCKPVLHLHSRLV